MSKFNVGDKVVIVSSGYLPNKPFNYLEVGDTGVILHAISEVRGIYAVVMDEGVYRAPMPGSGWAFYEHELALLED